MLHLEERRRRIRESRPPWYRFAAGPLNDLSDNGLTLETTGASFVWLPLFPIDDEHIPQFLGERPTSAGSGSSCSSNAGVIGGFGAELDEISTNNIRAEEEVGLSFGTRLSFARPLSARSSRPTTPASRPSSAGREHTRKSFLGVGGESRSFLSEADEQDRASELERTARRWLSAADGLAMLQDWDLALAAARCGTAQDVSWGMRAWLIHTVARRPLHGRGAVSLPSSAAAAVVTEELDAPIRRSDQLPGDETHKAALVLAIESLSGLVDLSRGRAAGGGGGGGSGGEAASGGGAEGLQRACLSTHIGCLYASAGAPDRALRFHTAAREILAAAAAAAAAASRDDEYTCNEDLDVGGGGVGGDWWRAPACLVSLLREQRNGDTGERTGCRDSSDGGEEEEEEEEFSGLATAGLEVLLAVTHANTAACLLRLGAATQRRPASTRVPRVPPGPPRRLSAPCDPPPCASPLPGPPRQLPLRPRGRRRRHGLRRGLAGTWTPPSPPSRPPPPPPPPWKPQPPPAEAGAPECLA